MQTNYSRILPYVFAALAVLFMYRRLRRNFGPQRLSQTRMGLRIGILILLGGSLLPAASHSAAILLADVLGLTAGIAVGVFGARRTRYQMVDERLHYLPHTYTGIAVSLLFVGRLVYRFVAIYSMDRGAGADHTAALSAYDSSNMVRSPFTAGLLYVVVGYYVCYYSMVLWKSRHISPEDLEVTEPSTATPTSM